jgi:hypothetical protein
MFAELRRDPRTHLTLPIRLADGQVAVATNISPSGMYMLSEGEHQVGERLSFEMDLQTAGMRFSAQAQVVRLDSRGGATGVALRLRDAKLTVFPDS